MLQLQSDEVGGWVFARVAWHPCFVFSNDVDCMQNRLFFFEMLFTLIKLYLYENIFPVGFHSFWGQQGFLNGFWGTVPG